MKSTDYDLLIIGGGMVGASLACALADLNLHVGLVEAAPFATSAHPSYDDRAIALAQGTKRIFQTLGLWEMLEPTVSPIRQIHISERGGVGFAHLDCRDEGVDALGYVAEARLIGAALLAKLPTLRGIELLCPARLEQIAIEPETARATLCFGDERIVELVEQPCDAGHGLVVVCAARSEHARALADGCTRGGYQTLVVAAGERFAAKDAVAIVWDTPIEAACDADEVSRMQRSAGGAPIFIVAGFPRADQVEAAKLAGVAAVISKPYLVRDLWWQLARAAETSRFMTTSG